MQKWEYCYIDRGDKDRGDIAAYYESATGGIREESVANGPLAYMTALGEQGWEMVGIEVRANTEVIRSGIGNFTPIISRSVYWFKRPTP
jgi:hypothetical protein